MKTKNLRLILAIALIAGSMLLFTSARFFGGSSYAEVLGIDVTGQDYIDGIYTGTADGFRPGIIVEVTISGGAVTSVVVVEHNELGRQYWYRPVEELPLSIIELQSTAVDTISGATATSKGILAAVEDALTQAQPLR